MFLTVICFAILCVSSFAADFSEAYLPETPVVINDWRINDPVHDYEWPCFAYNGITYIPLTFGRSNLLGLDVSWDEDFGLTINKSDLSVLVENIYGGRGRISWEAWEEAREAIHPADFKITVNGKEIDNAAEEYPFLVFKDITYFPLTWRFAVEEFGWTYSFDAENGLELLADSRFTTGDTLYYVTNGVKIWATAPTPGLGGPQHNNLYIEIDGVERQLYKTEDINDSFTFGYDIDFNTGNIFDVRDGWVYTTAAPFPAMFNGIAPQLCKVNIETGELVML